MIFRRPSPFPGAAKTTKITRQDHDAPALRAAARASDGKTAARLPALAFVLEGSTRAEAARRCGMDRQTLGDWVIRCNELGIASLSARALCGGTPARPAAGEKMQLADWVRQGPELAEDGVVRRRLSDLRRRLFERMFVTLDERSAGRIVRTPGFGHVAVRPRNPKADVDDRAAHKKPSPHWSVPPFRPVPATSRSSCGGRMRSGRAARQPDLRPGRARQPPARTARSAPNRVRQFDRPCPEATAA